MYISRDLRVKDMYAHTHFLKVVGTSPLGLTPLCLASLIDEGCDFSTEASRLGCHGCDIMAAIPFE